MCGIAGYVSAAARDGPAMVRSLAHRGPDAHGEYLTAIAGRQVFLGHTRLSIIDLTAAGTQPMFSADRQTVIIFNGEIYNYRELRREFLRDHAFRSGTDTEVLLALYERMGLECLQHLNGDFAFAVLDLRGRRLQLVRDRVGVKPLYTARIGRDLVFGSEVKALIAGGVRPVLDRDQLQSYFIFKYVPGEDTLFKGVRRLAPGTWLDYDLETGEIRSERWWRPDVTSRSAASYTEAAEQVAALVTDATRLRLVADVPVGNFLSGGLDSSIIASVIRHERQIAHYCARRSDQDRQFEGTSSDFDHAERLARAWSLRLQPIDVGAVQMTSENIRRTVTFADDLIADSAQIPTDLITRGAAASSRVFLSGMGADELFLGYPGHALTLLDQHVRSVPGAGGVVRWMARVEQGRGAFKSFRRYLYKLGKYYDYPEYRAAIFSLVGDFAVSASVVNTDTKAVSEFLAGYFPPGGDPFEAFKRFEFDNFLQKNLSYTDGMSMANSVEVRVPYLDHRIVNLAHSLPRAYKLSLSGGAKRVLRRAFRDVIPDHIQRRRKAGFAMPIRSLFASRERIDGLLNVGLLVEATGINATAVNELIGRHIAGVEENSSIIYALIALQEWCTLFL
ncbi:MAG: asparagine synthase (glutamine-hydrolyzing) [Steroidobacteraceae bacterium]